MDGKTIVETAVLSWTEKCWRTIIPKRPPTESKGNEAAWIIPPDKRRIMGKHVNKMLEEFNAPDLNGDRFHSKEELYGFFALVGIGTRWVDNTAVRWCLYLGERELKVGMSL